MAARRLYAGARDDLPSSPLFLPRLNISLFSIGGRVVYEDVPTVGEPEAFPNI